MSKYIVPTVALLLLIGATGCQEATPAAPSAAVSSGERFEVTGVVSDDVGTPLAGIVVTMRFYLSGFMKSPATRTDAAGAYKIVFNANPWTEPSRGRAAARADLTPDGYEWYYRTVYATAPQIVENFRLHRLQRIAPGESAMLPLGPDDGMCVTGLSWTLATVCRTVRVTAQENGTMMVQAISSGDGGQPLVSVCCVSGDDRGGNPVTLPVTAGTEFTVEVGLTGSISKPQSIMVKTSFDR